MKIYVGNLSWSLNDEDLVNLFAQYGMVNSAKIVKDKVTGRSRGFGFVEMTSKDSAQSAIAGLNDSEVLGRKIIVNESSSDSGSIFKKNFGKTLPLFFDSSEFTAKEISEIISELSDLYSEISGDYLIIRSSTVYNLILTAQPLFI